MLQLLYPLVVSSPASASRWLDPMGKEPKDAACAGQPSVSSVHTEQGGQGGECPGEEPAGDRDGDLSQGTEQSGLERPWTGVVRNVGARARAPGLKFCLFQPLGLSPLLPQFPPL